MTAPIVIKIGGHDIADEAYLAQFAQIIHDLATPVLIVHGGGKEISNLQTRLGIEPRYLDGVRITDAESLAIAEMVLCGRVNKRLVRHLQNANVTATGMSGVDGGLIQAVQMPHDEIDFQYTGTIDTVNTTILDVLLSANITPVIAPICYGGDTNYNVNADHVAGAVASAISASRIIFLTNVKGVLQDNALVPHLTPTQTQSLIDEGVIYGGMIPKVTTALHTLAQGVPEVMITNIDGLQNATGTLFTQDE